jgi:hypothetical protein
MAATLWVLRRGTEAVSLMREILGQNPPPEIEIEILAMLRLAAPPATKEVTRLRNLIARDIVGTESRSGPWSGAGQSLSGIWACSFPTSSKAKRRFRRFSSCTSLRTSAALQESVPYEVSFDLDALQGRATDHADRMNSSASPPIRAASWTSRTG